MNAQTTINVVLTAFSVVVNVLMIYLYMLITIVIVREFALTAGCFVLFL